ncbi:MAG: hypothetical protein WCD81_04075 [Candidatus Bathyarchaeia archaeon]
MVRQIANRLSSFARFSKKKAGGRAAVVLLLSVFLLEIYIPPRVYAVTFFSNGFEEGNYSAYSGTTVTTGCNLTVVGDIVRSGSYSSKSVTINGGGSNSYCYKTLSSALSTCYFRFYLYIDSTHVTSNQYMWYGEIWAANGYFTLFSVGIGRGSAIYIAYRSNGTVSFKTSSTTWSTGQWYCVELKRVQDASNGEVRLYINGAEVTDLTTTGLNTADYAAGRISIGQRENWRGNETSHADDIVVSDSYVGPLASSPQLSVTLNGPLTGSSLAAGTINFNYTPVCTGDNIQNASLWINETGTWQALQSNSSFVVNDTINTISYPLNGPGVYVWNIEVYNSTYGVFAQANSTLTIIPPPEPTTTVSLNAPSNGANQSSLSIAFAYTPTCVADTIQNSSLWTNASGTWQSVLSNSSAIQNNTQNVFTYVFASAGTYLWNVEVYNSTTGVFAPSNYTLTVFLPSLLSVALNSPQNGVSQSNATLVFSYVPTCVGDNIANSSLWTNATGSWLPTLTNSSAIANNTQNIFTYTFSANGTYVWNVQVFNRTTGIFAPSNWTVTLTPNVSTYFADGFEEGNYSAWTGTIISSGNLTIASSPVHTGSYSSKSFTYGGQGSNAYCYKTLKSTLATCYYRFYLYIDSTVSASNQYMWYGEIWDANGYFTLMSVGVSNGNKIFIDFRNSGTITFKTSATSWPIHQWCCVELKRVQSASNGEIRLYLNGVEVTDLTTTGLNTAQYAAGRVSMGERENWRGNETSYADDIVVSSSYIGPLTASQSVSVSSKSKTTGANMLTGMINFNYIPISTEGNIRNATLTPTTYNFELNDEASAIKRLKPSPSEKMV